MSRNAFGDLGGSYLGHAIRHSKQLRLIDLSANSLRESASLVIAHGCASLIELALLLIASW